jgi:hypothetical protein
MADKPTETPEPASEPDDQAEADEPVTKRDVGQVVKEFVDARLNDLGIFKEKEPDPEPAAEPDKPAASSHKTQDAIGQEWRADVEKEVERVLTAKEKSAQPAAAVVPAETPPAEKPPGWRQKLWS